MDVYNAIQGQIQNLEEACTNHERQLTQVESVTQYSVSAIEKMNGNITKISGNFDFYQELKHFVQNFTEFLDAKVSESCSGHGYLSHILNEYALII
jgi:hypothetical protein